MCINKRTETTYLIEGFPVFTVAPSDVPHHNVQSSSAQEGLVHTRVVNLPGTVVEFYRCAFESMSEQVDAYGAYFLRGPRCAGCMPRNDAVDQAAAPFTRRYNGDGHVMITSRLGDKKRRPLVHDLSLSLSQPLSAV